MQNDDQQALQNVVSAKKACSEAEYGSDEYFKAFVLWHNCSLELSGAERAKNISLVPFYMKGGKITLKDLETDITKTREFLAKKKEAQN
jgi:hypothetical protein